MLKTNLQCLVWKIATTYIKCQNEQKLHAYIKNLTDSMRILLISLSLYFSMNNLGNTVLALAENSSFNKITFPRCVDMIFWLYLRNGKCI